MALCTRIVATVVIAGFGLCRAAGPVPAAATPGPQQETTTPKTTPGAISKIEAWINATEAPWLARFAREVTAPYQAEVARMKQQYLATLDASLAKASATGNLELVVILRAERGRFVKSNDVPAEDDIATPAAVKAARDGWRTQKTRIEKERMERAKPVFSRYDAILAQAQTQLTQHQTIDEALVVKKHRERVAAAWLPGEVAAEPDKPAPGAQESVIKANSPDAYVIENVPQGTTISLEYVTGKWKSFGGIATENPDDRDCKYGDSCRMVIALPSKKGVGGRILAIVPPDTTKHPFVYRMNTTYPKVVLRINDQDNTYEPNPGSVDYKVLVERPGLPLLR